MRLTTIGWKFLCELKTGLSVGLNLETEPAFARWVPYALSEMGWTIAAN